MDLYSKLISKPQVFIKLTGLTNKEFSKLIVKLKPLWDTKFENKKKKSGRPQGLISLENYLLCLLFYYRTYTTQLFIGFLFRIDDSTVSRGISKLEPLLAKVSHIKKSRCIKEDELETLIVDATEQEINRPKKSQKKYYSGKKKRHTIKTEIIITKKGKIVGLSDSVPGSIHDFKLRKKSNYLPRNSKVLADSGYQGLQLYHKKSKIPIKKPKNKELDKASKNHNKELSRERIYVEHKIGQLKVFNILKQKYRNKRNKYGIKMNIIAGFVNMKYGF